MSPFGVRSHYDQHPTPAPLCRWLQGLSFSPKTTPGPGGRGSWGPSTGPFPCCCDGAKAAEGGSAGLPTGVCTPHPRPVKSRQLSDGVQLWPGGQVLSWPGEREWGHARPGPCAATREGLGLGNAGLAKCSGGRFLSPRRLRRRLLSSRLDSAADAVS